MRGSLPDCGIQQRKLLVFKSCVGGWVEGPGFAIASAKREAADPGARIKSWRASAACDGYVPKLNFVLSLAC